MHVHLIALATAIAAVQPATYTTSLRSATATIVLPVKDGYGERTLGGARITYRVGGRSASTVLSGENYGAEHLDVQEGFRFIDVPGIGYPLLFVNGMSCVRDCASDPMFFQFNPPSATLERVPTYDMGMSAEPRSGVPCVTVPHPQYLYAWSTSMSLVALASNTTIVTGVFAVKVPQLAIVFDQVHPSTPHPTPADYEKAASPMKLQVTRDNKGVLTFTPCS